MSLKTTGRIAACLLACAIAPLATAADAPIRIARVIPYESDDVGAANVRQCNWNEQLSRYIVQKSGGRVQATTETLTDGPGRTLRLAITRAHTAGGGSISGPKWGRVDGQLWEDGAMIGNFSIKRASNRPFTLSVCGPLTKIAEVLSSDINAWLQHPTLDPNAGKDTPDADGEAADGAQQAAGTESKSTSASNQMPDANNEATNTGSEATKAGNN